jgi:hypothetical protein
MCVEDFGDAEIPVQTHAGDGDQRKRRVLDFLHKQGGQDLHDLIAHLYGAT